MVTAGAASASRSALIYELTSIIERIEFARVFPKEQAVEVELGSGDGTFLAEMAAAKRNHNFIGIERLLGRIQKMSRKGTRASLTNLAGVRIESEYFLQYLLPANSIHALHVYFPDPWPKRKHQQKRLINERFPDLARQVLQDEGRVFLRTDDEDYFAQMHRVFSGHPAFVPIDTPMELASIVTDFEREFNTKGIPTLRAAFERR